MIVNDIDAEELKKPTLHVDMPVHADVRDLLEAMERVLDADGTLAGAAPMSEECIKAQKEWLSTCQGWKRDYPVVLPRHLSGGTETEANVYAFAHEMSRRLNENQIVVVGNGSANVVCGHANVMKKGQRFISNSGIASMGYGLPASIGACVADHSQDVILVTGDGSLQMNIQELETVISHYLPIKIFVINNGGYHSIRQTQKNFFGEPLIGIGVDSGDLSFPSLEKLGYQVFVQAVSITSYSDRELLDLVDLVNELNPYALSLVDTYGLLHQDNLLHYFRLLNYNLNPEIAIGYHSHNNFQLAYSNSMEVLKEPVNRTVLIDASLYGMGKSAGNLPIELISMYLNTSCGRSFQISQLLEAIDISIMPIYQKSPWGYNLFFYISASNHCHPNYVRFLMDKNTLSLKSINAILETIEPEKKLLYDKDYAEQLYVSYQSMECCDETDLAALRAAWENHPLLLLGPGANMELQKDRIQNYIRRVSPTIVAVNFIPEDIRIHYAFLSNSRRYVQLNNRLLELSQAADRPGEPVRIIATSNVMNVKNNHFDYTLNYSALIDREAEIVDNSFIMLLHVLTRTGVRHAACAGFDGYTVRGENYFNSDMDYRIAREKSESINQYVRNILKQLQGQLTLEFLTDSHYTNPSGPTEEVR